MAENIFLLDSPAIERAVMGHNTVNYPPRRFGKSNLDELPAVTSGGGFEYNGYFKIVAVPVAGADGQPTRQVEVRIVDGATYTADGTSGNSTCYVNNTRHGVPPYRTRIDYVITEAEIVEYFSLQYTPGNYSVSVVRHDGLRFPLNSVLIGRVIIRNGKVSAIQDSYGIARIMWFALCNDGSESESGGTAE